MATEIVDLAINSMVIFQFANCKRLPGRVCCFGSWQVPAPQVILPEGLQHLTFGHDFAQTLDGFKLPGSLQMLGRVHPSQANYPLVNVYSLRTGKPSLVGKSW